MSNIVVPPHILAIQARLGEEGAEAIHCKCNAVASHFEETHFKLYRSGECFTFGCSVASCKNKSWAWCKSCKKRFGNNNTEAHVTSKRHKASHFAIYGVEPGQPLPTTSAVNTTSTDQVSTMTNQTANMEFEFPGGPSFDEEDAASIADMDPEKFFQVMDQDYSETFIEGDALEKDASIPPNLLSVRQQYPKISLEGNEWLAEAFRDTPRATCGDIAVVFADVHNVRLFWIAEQSSPPGRCGGGLRYLVARMFQNVNFDAPLDAQRIPDVPEALWHFESFIQYHTLNEVQRQRQARITKTIMDISQQQSGTFFKHTRIPEYKELSRMYGKTGKQSLWNTLPIPPVEDIGGVAYVSPIHIVKFLFAFGVPVDDILVEFDKGDMKEHDRSKKVLYVSDTAKTTNWIRDLIETVKRSNLEPGTKVAVCAWMSYWEDGFGPSRVKNNRGSIGSATITCATPKSLINATSNTFLMACGLKKASGWNAVRERCRKDMLQLTSKIKPVMVYHGTLQKVVPVFLKQFACITDKIERPDVTSTIGSMSTVHRCFGVAGMFITPKCKVEEAKTFLTSQVMGMEDGSWGWSDKLIDKATGANGANLPSCIACRKKRLVRLGAISATNNVEAGDNCQACTDWRPLPNDEACKLLDTPVHSDYPKFCNPGCPVAPPCG